MASTWQPILDGSLAERARAVVDDIARALPGPGEVVGDTGMFGDPTLFSGDAGLALVWAYRHFAEPRAEDADRAERHLDAAIETVARVELPEGLHSGFAGIAWVAEHLAGRLLPDDDVNASIDEALLHDLGTARLRPYDLVLGLVGLGVYAVERVHHASGGRCLEAVLQRLAETAERSEGRATWFTSPALSSSVQRRWAPHGHHNLGMAHGVPGVIGLLATAIAAGVDPPGLRELLHEAVTSLFGCALPGERQTVVPNYVAQGVEGTDGRSGWCYGDPGAASAVLLAARATGNEAWEREAIRWMRKCAARPMEDAGVRDTGLCHGAAGLAHIFNRVYQATGIDELGDAARRWFVRTLDMRRDDGIAGFPIYVPRRDGSESFDAGAGLMSGAAGVAMALLAAATPVEPAWDRCMLVDIPSSA